MVPSERELLRRAQAGDEQALGEVYDGVSPQLYRYAYRLLGDARLAEDVVAETFYRWLQALRAGRGPQEHLSAYLYRIAHNLVIDHWRRRLTAPDPLEAASQQTSSAALDGVDDQLGQAAARAALWKLTPEQRQVILLKFFEGMSNAEIAAALEKPEGAIKSLQHRALSTLKRVLLASHGETVT